MALLQRESITASNHGTVQYGSFLRQVLTPGYLLFTLAHATEDVAALFSRDSEERYCTTPPTIVVVSATRGSATLEWTKTLLRA